MNSWSFFFYVFISGALLLLSILGLTAAVVLPGTDRRDRRFFTALFTVFLILAGLCLADIVLRAYPAAVTAGRIIRFFLSLLSLLPVLMLVLYLLRCCRENRCKGRRRRLSPKTFYAFLAALFLLAAVLTIHLFIPVYPLLAAGLAVFALVIYGFIWSEQIRQYQVLRQENLLRQQEIAEKQSGITALQMRPHFIYNTLMSIYSLCNQDPGKARQVTKDFTTYLRNNYKAIASESTIPFTAELEHIHAYLAVEQTLFEDMLFVEYDTPHTDFHLPALSLQPIVENAVKHGMNPYSGPLHILIRTQDTDSGSMITVKDDGPGFDPSDSSKPHVTLTNIQNRMEMMCGGKIEILSGTGDGTLVKVTIPHNRTGGNS